MRDLTDSTEIVDDGAALRSRLCTDGYLYLRRYLPDDAVGAVRAAVTAVLEDSCWLADGTDPSELVASDRAVGEGTCGFHGTYTAVQMLQQFHELAVQPRLTELAELLLGGPVFCHPAHICRISPPVTQAASTPTHQDYRLVQGAADTLTAWVPLADCPQDVGGLRVLAGSHRDGLLPVEHVDAPGNVSATVADDDPRWRSTSFTAGDVLLFPSLTAHGARPDASDRLRLSADFRYQARTDPVTTGSGICHPHYHPTVPGWRTLTRHWTSTHSIEMPAGVPVVPRFDPHATDLPAPPSRFTGTLPTPA